jgi:hypothetical protein
MDLGDWLRNLGLGQYEAAFRENEIDDAILPNLSSTTSAFAHSGNSTVFELGS